MGVKDMFSDALGGTKRGLFGGAKTKAVIVLTQYWSEDQKKAADGSKAIDKNGNVSVGGLSKSAKTGEIKIEKPVTVAVAKSSGLGGGALGAASKLGSASDALSKASSLASTVSKVADAVTGALTDNSNTDSAGQMREGQKDIKAGMTRYSVEYTVMFNPETLEISSRSGGLVPKKRFNQAENGTSDTGANFSVHYVESTNKSVSLSVQLIFDKVDPTDAFTEVDPFNVGSKIGMAKKALMLKKGQTYSVQRDVEGFIAAIQDKSTSEVCFRWGDMEYSGVITQVDAKYTMFNPAGEPIRAVVALTLRIIDPAITVCSMGGYFDEAFRNVLESDEIQEKGYISWNNWKNKTGSIL